MKTTKTYATLANAYAAVEKAGAEHFDLTYNGGQTLRAIEHTFKRRADVTVAKWNLVRYEKTLCALECTTAKDGKTTYKWTAIGTFDSDGLLYPISADKPAPTQTTAKDKPKADKKPRTRKPAQGKGDNKPTKTPLQLELDTLAGTGNNSKAHKIMCKHGLKNSNSDEYKAVWQGYWWTIR